MNSNIEIIQKNFDKGLGLLKVKDELVMKLRQRIQEYESRILKLEGELEELNLKLH